MKHKRKLFFGLLIAVVLLVVIGFTQYLFFPVDQQRALEIGNREFARFCQQRHLSPDDFEGPQVQAPKPKFDYYWLTWYPTNDRSGVEIYVRIGRTGDPSVTYKGDIRSPRQQ